MVMNHKKHPGNQRGHLSRVSITAKPSSQDRKTGQKLLEIEDRYLAVIEARIYKDPQEISILTTSNLSG
jgi:hypothetical protein